MIRKRVLRLLVATQNSFTMSMADQDEATAAVVEGLKRLYHTKLKPLEQTYMFAWFHSPPLTDSEFESKPQVLMCGQYSTGKTSVSSFVDDRRYHPVGIDRAHERLEREGKHTRVALHIFSSLLFRSHSRGVSARR